MKTYTYVLLFFLHTTYAIYASGIDQLETSDIGKLQVLIDLQDNVTGLASKLNEYAQNMGGKELAELLNSQGSIFSYIENEEVYPILQEHGACAVDKTAASEINYGSAAKDCVIC